MKDTEENIVLWRDARLIIVICMVILGLVFVLGRQYYRHKKYLKEILREQKAESLHNVGKRKIPLYVSEKVKSPITVGILKPAILLPAKELDDGEREMIVRHELQHIRSGDLFLNFVAVIMISLHWYNPLAYYWIREVKVLQELRCDENVVRDMNAEQRYSYAQLILAFFKREEKNNLLVSSLSGGAKRVSERMDRIMMERKSKKKFGFMFACILVMSVFLSSLTVLAYNPPKGVADVTGTLDAEEVAYLYETGTFTEGESWEEMYVDELIIPGKNVFEGVDGTVYYYDAESEVETTATCVHQYVDGEYKQHIINGENCQMNIYEAQRCTECDDLEIGKKISTLTFSPCPH